MTAFIFSQPFSFMETVLGLPFHDEVLPHDNPLCPGAPSIPYRCVPMYNMEDWIYTNGSDINEHIHLGATVTHILSRTTLYINTAGCDKTRTIMRAELVAIHTALAIFEDHPCIGVFKESMSSLRAIRNHWSYESILPQCACTSR